MRRYNRYVFNAHHFMCKIHEERNQAKRKKSSEKRKSSEKKELNQSIATVNSRTNHLNLLRCDAQVTHESLHSWIKNKASNKIQ